MKTVQEVLGTARTPSELIAKTATALERAGRDKEYVDRFIRKALDDMFVSDLRNLCSEYLGEAGYIKDGETLFW